MSKIDAVLSCDPGKESFAWAYIALDGTLIDCGTLKHPIDDMRAMQFLAQFPLFLAEVNRLFKRKDVKLRALVAERLTPRPGYGSGATCEFINLALGALYVVSRLNRVKHICPTMPSTWKGWLARLTTGKSKLETSATAFGYPQVLKNPRKTDNFGLYDHEFDAIGIGLWFVCNNELKPIANNLQLAKYSKCLKSIKKMWNARVRK
jgi:hypothetical protein